MQRDIRIAIIGGGISGLVSAISLAHFGFRVELFEQAEEFSDVGAGITLGPNASRVLIALGLVDKLQSHIWTPRHAAVLHFASGETLSYSVRGDNYINEFGAPFWHIHRADLLSVLLASCHENERIELNTNHQVSSITQDDKQVEIKFTNGSSKACEVLIACDGIKSIIRGTEFSTAEPKFTGYVAWRGLVDRNKIPDYEIYPDFALYVGLQRMFGRYAVRNRSLINYVAISTADTVFTEGWSVKADVSDVQQEFAGWCEAVQTLLENTPQQCCYKYALHTREPLSTWLYGRVALLGDAAHPMMPFLGLGAGIGIEDAMVLARAFDSSEQWQEALVKYEKTRLEHANRAQAESAKQGLYLLGKKPKDGDGKQLYGEDALGLYSYDAVTVPI